MRFSITKHQKYGHEVFRFEQYGIVHFCHREKFLKWRFNLLRIPCECAISDSHLWEYWLTRLQIRQTHVTREELRSLSSGIGALGMMIRRGDNPKGAKSLFDELQDQVWKHISRLGNPYEHRTDTHKLV